MSVGRGLGDGLDGADGGETGAKLRVSAVELDMLGLGG